MTPEKLMRKK